MGEVALVDGMVLSLRQSNDMEVRMSNAARVTSSLVTPATHRAGHQRITCGWAIWAGVFVVWLAVGEAVAECMDPAEPGVTWRRCIMDGSNLTGLDLSGSDLRDTSLKRADLSGTILDGTNLTRAKFVSASLPGASFDGANLTLADFTNADLTGASFRGASLRRARLFSADLRDADLTGALLEGADLLHSDMSGATWIDGETICAEGSNGRCVPAPASTESKAENR